MVRVGERTALGWAGARRRRGELAALLLGLGLACVAAAAWAGRGGGGARGRRIVAEEEEEPEATPPPRAKQPWGVDFDIKFVKSKRQWQISNLVLHPPAPSAPPVVKKAVVTKPTFPFFELRDMNKADKMVRKKLKDRKTDPKLKDALLMGMDHNTGALEAAIGCEEGSSPGSSIKTSCPGIGSGKPREVKREWNMGFPPDKGGAAQQNKPFKRRGMTPEDVPRGMMGIVG